MSTLPPDEPNGGTPPPPPPPPPSGGYGNYGDAYGAPPPPPPPPAGPSEGPWSVGNALSYGWAKFQAYVGPSIILALLVLVVGIVFGGIGYAIRSGVTSSPHFDSNGNFHDGSGFFVGTLLGNGITSALSFLAQTAVGAVVIRAALDVTAGQAPNVGEAINRVPWAKVIVLALIQAVAVFIGFLLCILPGIILSFLFYFATYYVIDRGMEPVDALKESVSLVTKNVGTALLWAIVGTIVGIAGICACGVGFLVTFPLVTYGTAYTFKKLTGQPVAA